MKCSRTVRNNGCRGVDVVGSELYSRFSVERPKYLGDEHWASISIEVDRLHRSLEAGDRSQVLGDLKCLVESVARVTLDIAGEPAQPNAAFDQTVKRAHDLLASQPGDTLAQGGEFSRIASNSCRIARSLGGIRNEFGGGHGRSRVPEVRAEMVDLGLDGGLTWSRWAVRRLGLFSMGRPNSLIRDLVEDSATFHSGILEQRLEAANLSGMDAHHQREVGVAVGQRVMRGTFVVKWDGLDPCLNSDDLDVWPEGYRVGLLRGLWFSPEGWPTVGPRSIRDGLSVLDPVADCADVLSEQVEQVVAHTAPGLPNVDSDALRETAEWIKRRMKVRPDAEACPLKSLREHIDPQV